MNNVSVTVIIPTFNRAHLISHTIPTYFQDNVCEVIVIDDNSTDNTSEVVKQLQSKIPQIQYIKSEKKIRQTGAKNLGLLNAKGKYIYFGDDDSILKNGSISHLLRTSIDFPNSIIAVRHIYMKENDKIENILKDDTKDEKFTTIFNPKNLKLNISASLPNIIQIPFCQACFLIPSSLIGETKFNEIFLGTCYREETDFIMQIAAKGHLIYLDNFSLQINLPRSVSTGGVRSVNLFYRHFSEIINEYIFFKRNKNYIKTISTINTSPFIRSFFHFFNKIYKFFK
jgi:glycosyltransferase involved in cell wall biosynthesis